MRSYMRDLRIKGEGNEDAAKAVGMTGVQIERMYRLLAIVSTMTTTSFRQLRRRFHANRDLALVAVM